MTNDKRVSGQRRIAQNIFMEPGNDFGNVNLISDRNDGGTDERRADGMLLEQNIIARGKMWLGTNFIATSENRIVNNVFSQIQMLGCK